VSRGSNTNLVVVYLINIKELQLKASSFKAGMEYKCFSCLNRELWLPLSTWMRGAQQLIQAVMGSR